MSDSLADFQKNASFRPNMLNYLNKTFTSGKQTKDNLVYRKVQCGPTDSFIHSFLCPLFFTESRRGSSPRKTQNYHDQHQSQIVLLAPHQDGTKRGRRCSHATWSLDKLWAAFPWV